MTGGSGNMIGAMRPRLEALGTRFGAPGPIVGALGSGFLALVLWGQYWNLWDESGIWGRGWGLWSQDYGLRGSILGAMGHWGQNGALEPL